MQEPTKLRKRLWTLVYLYALIPLMVLAIAAGVFLPRARVLGSDDDSGMLGLIGMSLAPLVFVLWLVAYLLRMAGIASKEREHALAWESMVSRSKQLQFPGDDRHADFYKELPGLPFSRWHMSGMASNTVTRQVEVGASADEVNRTCYRIFEALHALALPGAIFTFANVDGSWNGVMIWPRSQEIQLWTRFRGRVVGAVMEVSFWSGHMCRFSAWRDQHKKRIRGDDEAMAAIFHGRMWRGFFMCLFTVFFAPLAPLAFLFAAIELRKLLLEECDARAGETSIWAMIEARRSHMPTNLNDGASRELQAVKLELEAAMKRALLRTSSAGASSSRDSEGPGSTGRADGPGSAREGKAGPTLE